MRLFFAAPLQEPARARIALIVQKLAATGADYKWVEPENLHLTLAFLGETPQARLPELQAALGAAAAGKSAFTLRFDHIGAFDSLDRPRVLWLGASAGESALAEIAKPLIPPDEKRPFKAHLTLGRQRGPKNLSRLKELIREPGDVDIESRVDRIELMRSRLSSKGPAYEALREVRLG